MTLLVIFAPLNHLKKQKYLFDCRVQLSTSQWEARWGATWLPFTLLYLCPLVVGCVKAGETGLPVVETEVIMWSDRMLFFLQLKYKTALTVSVNKRDRSSMGTGLVTSVLLCNTRKEKGRLLQWSPGPARKNLFYKWDCGFTDSSQDWRCKMYERKIYLHTCMSTNRTQHGIQNVRWLCNQHKLIRNLSNGQWLHVLMPSRHIWPLCHHTFTSSYYSVSSCVCCWHSRTLQPMMERQQKHTVRFTKSFTAVVQLRQLRATKKVCLRCIGTIDQWFSNGALQHTGVPWWLYQYVVHTHFQIKEQTLAKNKSAGKPLAEDALANQHTDTRPQHAPQVAAAEQWEHRD